MHGTIKKDYAVLNELLI